MAKLVTNTGKEFDCDFAGEAAQHTVLMTTVYGVTVPQAYEVFSDANETKRLVYKDVIDGQPVEREHKGFVVFSGIDIQGDGLMLTLTRKFEEAE